MTPAQWQRVRALFDQLVDAPPDEAVSRLEQADDDGVVKAEVRSLLEHHSRAGSFLEHPPALVSTPDRGIAPGGSVGPYAIVREIGRGGMGRVYLATDTRLSRRVCLKAVREDLADVSFRARLQREARTAASLSHPGICAVYALEEFDDCLYLVTEFIDGRTLRQEMETGERPAVGVVLETMRQLTAAIAAAHTRGITHRDLKPENIMRTSDGRLKVLDFGLARMEETAGTGHGVAVTSPGMLVGTLRYMAPEQLEGRTVGPSADVFALGIFGYEFAAGVHPFAAETPLASAARVLGDRPTPLHVRRADLPPAFLDLIDRSLAREPEARFATAGEMAAVLDGDPTRDRWLSRRRVWWRIHQIAVIALYAIGVAMAWKIHDWEAAAAARWAFLFVGMLAAINGVVRGHLLFTERAHPARLAAERQRTRGAMLALDLVIGLALVADASLFSFGHPVVAALVLGLGAGIGTAAVLIEPATSRAAIGAP